MFGKIFASMYDGTLATKGPWQALVTFQQFLVLKDRAGIVDMTADAIARRTTIPIEIIKIGIAALEQPDNESRSSELEGRRIVLLDDSRPWGWRVVNHEKYNKIRSEEDRREYMRNLMANKRANEKKALAPVSDGEQKLAKLANVDVDVDVDVDVKPLSRTKAPKTVSIPDGFQTFWDHYPRKQDKANAIKEWQKLAPDIETQRAISAGLGNAINSADWQKENGKFIPYACRWIKYRRWEDEQPTAKTLGYDPKVLAMLRQKFGQSVRPVDGGKFYDPGYQRRYDVDGTPLLVI
tara:strand:+ start:1664 stop:2545 length:882 start_codon:yes stop_codon:yes gene_type:complete